MSKDYHAEIAAERDAAIARAEKAEGQRDYWMRARNEWAKAAEILTDENKIMRACIDKIRAEYSKPDGSYWADNLITAVHQSLARITAARNEGGE